MSWQDMQGFVFATGVVALLLIALVCVVALFLAAMVLYDRVTSLFKKWREYDGGAALRREIDELRVENEQLKQRVGYR